jgi:hypothetical protein
MINLSTRLLLLFGLPLIAVFGVSCAQPGTAAPTSPSLLSARPSATAVGPSAGYDASGTWCIANTDAHGNLDGERFQRVITQDPATGDLLLTDEDGSPVRLERLSNGQGAIITYRISLIGSESNSACDIRVQGTVRLDTSTNTFTGMVRLKQLGCDNARQGAGVTGTKQSCPAT